MHPRTAGMLCRPPGTKREKTREERELVTRFPPRINHHRELVKEASLVCQCSFLTCEAYLPQPNLRQLPGLGEREVKLLSTVCVEGMLGFLSLDHLVCTRTPSPSLHLSFFKEGAGRGVL